VVRTAGTFLALFSFARGLVVDSGAATKDDVDDAVAGVGFFVVTMANL